MRMGSEMESNMDNMPTIDQFRPVILRVLNDGEVCAAHELCERVADYMKLSEDVRNQRIPSGQRRYINRVQWARSGLTAAGLLDRPKRGEYRITENGRNVDSRNLTSYGEQDMYEWPVWCAYQEELRQRKERSQVANAPLDVEEDPLGAIEARVEDLNNSTETKLLQKLRTASPSFFEKAVLEVLLAMGYGGAYGVKEHLGQPGDNGVDGTIKQDALGLRNVYVQAKRYAEGNNVGGGDIRNFYGALAVKGADHGVFITTSSFTHEAVATAESYKGKIVLIDGIQLTSLMLEYKVGVQKVKHFTVFKVDDDFFEEDAEI